MNLLPACPLVLAVACLPAADPRPNIVLILADDQDWSGTSVRMDPDEPRSGDRRLRTPALARLAAAGMVFSRAYAAAPVCSPSRACLQTGFSPAALHWTKAAPADDPAEGWKLATPRSARDLAASSVTVGEILQGAGYATAHFGKWHLEGGGPAAHGYAVHDGETGNHDAERFPADNPDDVFGMPRRAAAFMAQAQQAGTPFFAQLSVYPLHHAEAALPASLARARAAMPDANEQDIARAAILEDLDTGLGRLFDDLDRLGLAASTLVIYTADNGGGGRGGCLRGGKGTLFEGGIRVPFIVRGPGVPAGAVCRTPIGFADLLPTIAGLAGAAAQVPAGIEGGDVAPLLRGGDAPVVRPRPGLFFHFPHYQGAVPQAAMIDGDDKLLYDFESGRGALYDLRADPGESRDQAATRAERAGELRTRLMAWLGAVKADLPTPNPLYDPARQPQGKGGKAGRGGGRKSPAGP